MSDTPSLGMPSSRVPGEDDDAAAESTTRERVALGLAAAAVAVLAGIVATVVLWRLGYVAALSSLLIAAGATFLYTKASGSVPRRGLGLLVLLILVGVVASFFAVVVSDLWDAYDAFIAGQFDVSRGSFIRQNVFAPDVLSTYGKDMAFFAVFAVLGTFGSLRRLLTTD